MNLAKFDERAIINGYNAPDRPFYVQIRLYRYDIPSSYDLCGGTIISPQHVLTGAHCFRTDGTNRPMNWDWIEVFVGDMSQPYYESAVTKLEGINYTVHPGYTGYTQQGYDLAILKLNQTVGSARILRLCTSRESYLQQYPMAACGFGETVAEDTKSDPAQLKETQMQQTGTDTRCGYDNIFNKEIQICMGSIPGRRYSGTCQGDSGGPLFPLNDGDNSQQPICLYGTTSFGATKDPTCDGDVVFNRVSYFYDWIKEQVQKDQIEI